MFTRLWSKIIVEESTEKVLYWTPFRSERQFSCRKFLKCLMKIEFNLQSDKKNLHSDSKLPHPLEKFIIKQIRCIH